MRYNDEYKVVEKKRGGFWPFVGGLILGAVAVKTIQDMSKKEEKNKTTDGVHISVIRSEFKKMFEYIDTNDNNKRYVGGVFMNVEQK